MSLNSTIQSVLKHQQKNNLTDVKSAFVFNQTVDNYLVSQLKALMPNASTIPPDYLLYVAWLKAQIDNKTVVGEDVTVGSDKVVLGGDPTAAALKAFSIDIDPSKIDINDLDGVLEIIKGGTGLSTIGSSGQLIRVNGLGTALEYFTANYEPAITWAQGDLLYGTGVNTYANLAKTTSATRYLSNTGTSNNPAWSQVDLTNGVSGILPIANGGTGLGLYAGWDLISTATASSSSTIDFTDLSSTYAFYKIVYYDVLPVTNSVSFRIRVGTGGTPTYDTGNNYGWTYVYAQNGASGGGGNTTDSSISLVNATVSNNSQRAIYGDITIYNPSQTSTYHVIDYNFNMQNDTTALITRTLGQGTYRSTTAVTAIRLYFSSGNIASGVFKLYGIR